jgi:hypothetical protein
MAATVHADGDEIERVRVEELFAITFPYGAYHAFDVSPDGSRILANVNIGAGVPTQQARAESGAW